MLLQISSGQGPRECEQAVGLLGKSLQKEFANLELVAQRGSGKDNCFTSILLRSQVDLSHLAGTIEWICKSQFRPHHKRKNWFVHVSVVPECEQVVREGEIIFERFHCGGNGGQNVNKVETGVRLVHVPTGITVVCTEERSQHQNRQRALSKLENKLQELELQAQNKQRGASWREHTRLVRGNPVRVYEGVEFRRKV